MEKLRLIGVCITSIHQLEIQRVLIELGAQAEKRGYHLQIFAPFTDFYHHSPSDQGERHIFDFIPYESLEGLIIFNAHIKDESLSKELASRGKAQGIPVISVKAPIEGCCNIRYDVTVALRKMICHLIEVHHCKNIHFMAGLAGNSVSEERLQVYKTVLTEYNQEVIDSHIHYGDFWFGPAMAATEKLLASDEPLPDAIVCANDAMALAVCDCLAKHHICVPQDIIITGLGAILERNFHRPLLSTAVYDPALTSQYILDTMEDIAAQALAPDSEVVIPCTNEYTESCGCVKYDKHNSDSLLNSLFNVMEQERGYRHATHEFTAFLNADCRIENFTKLFPDYIQEPGIYACNLYLTIDYGKSVALPLVTSTKNDAMVLLNHIQEGTGEIPVKAMSIPEMLKTDWELYAPGKQILSIPLSSQEHFYGILTIQYDGANLNHNSLYELVMTIDDLLDGIKRHKELLQTSEQLNMVSEQTIQSLAEIVEAKSEFTGLHVKRVSEYTRILAEAMGYSPEKVDTIRIASMMHDIGKINIPSSILEKPGKLTDEEFEVIKTHITEGEKLLRHAPGEIMQMARIIALQHHEKWNGTGYLGIRGDEISLESRIVALADVFDALVSKRPYKKPFPVEKAYDIITGDSGSHFDPAVVAAFQDNFEKFQNIRNQYADD